MGRGFPIFEPANPTNQERKTDPIRVLLVEDDEDYREIVGSELSWHGFAVRSFADGASLLGSLDTAAEADVIVLDWRLPNISGIDLLPQLRQRGVTLPVVFLTSHADPASEKLAFDRGALDFVDKARGVEILARRLRLAAKSGKPAAAPETEKPIVCGKCRSLPGLPHDLRPSILRGLRFRQRDTRISDKRSIIYQAHSSQVL
jgi:two-component system response regulator ChvI